MYPHHRHYSPYYNNLNHYSPGTRFMRFENYRQPYNHFSYHGVQLQYQGNFRTHDVHYHNNSFSYRRATRWDFNGNTRNQYTDASLHNSQLSNYANNCSQEVRQPVYRQSYKNSNEFHSDISIKQVHLSRADNNEVILNNIDSLQKQNNILNNNILANKSQLIDSCRSSKNINEPPHSNISFQSDALTSAHSNISFQSDDVCNDKHTKQKSSIVQPVLQDNFSKNYSNELKVINIDNASPNQINITKTPEKNVFSVNSDTTNLDEIMSNSSNEPPFKISCTHSHNAFQSDDLSNDKHTEHKSCIIQPVFQDNLPENYSNELNVINIDNASSNQISITKTPEKNDSSVNSVTTNLEQVMSNSSNEPPFKTSCTHSNYAFQSDDLNNDKHTEQRSGIIQPVLQDNLPKNYSHEQKVINIDNASPNQINIIQTPKKKDSSVNSVITNLEQMMRYSSNINQNSKYNCNLISINSEQLNNEQLKCNNNMNVSNCSKPSNGNQYSNSTTLYESTIESINENNNTSFNNFNLSNAHELEIPLRDANTSTYLQPIFTNFKALKQTDSHDNHIIETTSNDNREFIKISTNLSYCTPKFSSMKNFKTPNFGSACGSSNSITNSNSIGTQSIQLNSQIHNNLKSNIAQNSNRNINYNNNNSTQDYTIEPIDKNVKSNIANEDRNLQHNTSKAINYFETFVKNQMHTEGGDHYVNIKDYIDKESGNVTESSEFSEHGFDFYESPVYGRTPDCINFFTNGKTSQTQLRDGNSLFYSKKNTPNYNIEKSVNGIEKLSSITNKPDQNLSRKNSEDNRDQKINNLKENEQKNHKIQYKEMCVQPEDSDSNKKKYNSVKRKQELVTSNNSGNKTKKLKIGISPIAPYDKTLNIFPNKQNSENNINDESLTEYNSYQGNKKQAQDSNKKAKSLISQKTNSKSNVKTSLKTKNSSSREHNKKENSDFKSDKRGSDFVKSSSSEVIYTKHDEKNTQKKIDKSKKTKSGLKSKYHNSSKVSEIKSKHQTIDMTSMNNLDNLDLTKSLCDPSSRKIVANIKLSKESESYKDKYRQSKQDKFRTSDHHHKSDHKSAELQSDELFLESIPSKTSNLTHSQRNCENNVKLQLCSSKTDASLNKSKEKPNSTGSNKKKSERKTHARKEKHMKTKENSSKTNKSAGKINIINIGSELELQSKKTNSSISKITSEEHDTSAEFLSTISISKYNMLNDEKCKSKNNECTQSLNNDSLINVNIKDLEKVSFQKTDIVNVKMQNPNITVLKNGHNKLQNTDTKTGILNSLKENNTVISIDDNMKETLNSKCMIPFFEYTLECPLYLFAKDFETVTICDSFRLGRAFQDYIFVLEKVKKNTNIKNLIKSFTCELVVRFIIDIRNCFEEDYRYQYKVHLTKNSSNRALEHDILLSDYKTSYNLREVRILILILEISVKFRLDFDTFMKNQEFYKKVYTQVKSNWTIPKQCPNEKNIEDLLILIYKKIKNLYDLWSKSGTNFNTSIAVKKNIKEEIIDITYSSEDEAKSKETFNDLLAQSKNIKNNLINPDLEEDSIINQETEFKSNMFEKGCVIRKSGRHSFDSGFSEELNSTAVNRDHITCASCDKSAQLKCGGCKYTCYCSKNCQNIHWISQHKNECSGAFKMK